MLSFSVVVAGEVTALADRPDDPGANGNGAAAYERGQEQAEEHANVNARVFADGPGGVDAEVPVDDDEPDDASGDVDTAVADVSPSRRGGNGNGAGRPSKITICHATHSVRLPYVRITVARSAADGLAGPNEQGDHFDHHGTGVVFDPNMQQGVGWDDIIPPSDDDGNPMPHNGLHWEDGRETWESDCRVIGRGPEPEPEISVRIDKTNDANEDGIFTNFEEAKLAGQAVEFHLTITNTSEETVLITSLLDTFEGTVVDLLATGCATLDGAILDPGERVPCGFSLDDYAPPAEAAVRNVARVCVRIVGGDLTDCADNPSRVRSPQVLGRTVTPPTRTPPGGLAFTGAASVVQLAVLALALFTSGTGLLWAGHRRSGGRRDRRAHGQRRRD
jgi:hypothetical protein